MSKPIVVIHNTETNEIVEREMTAAEFAQYKKDQTEKAAKQAETEAKEAERQAILDRLGLTADELKLILG
jgi:predicted flap endonuclease-1-like 5' DNA nuclease